MPSGTNKMGNNGGREYSFLNKPVWIDCNFVVDSTNGNGLGIRSLKGSGVRNVFMHTSATPGKGQGGFLNPNPAAGYALIQLHNNYNRYAGGFYGAVSPLSGSNVAINGSALTVGNPYVIVSTGHGTAGAVTIAPVADSSGSLASTWFSLYDSFGNTFIIWFSVSGVGRAPVGVSGTLVQQSITTNDTAATIGADLVVTINGLLAQTPQNPNAPAIANFSAAGTTTVTVTNVQNVSFPGGPQDGTVPTGFTFAVTRSKTNNQNWANVGLPQGVLPNVGASFIATATGDANGSTGLVQAPTVSGISVVEVVGDPNQSLGPVPLGVGAATSANIGGWIMISYLAATNSSTTTLVATAPANNSVVGLGFYVEAGSILIAGE